MTLKVPLRLSEDPEGSAEHDAVFTDLDNSDILPVRRKTAESIDDIMPIRHAISDAPEHMGTRDFVGIGACAGSDNVSTRADCMQAGPTAEPEWIGDVTALKDSPPVLSAEFSKPIDTQPFLSTIVHVENL